MSHADALILVLHTDLAARVPALPCIELHDEPGGDFGVAHYLGIRGLSYPVDDGTAGCAILTFDDDKTPSHHTVAHELGHALAGACGWTDELYRGYFSARGFPVTIEYARAKAIDLASVDPWHSWRCWPEESFAECFAASMLGDETELTTTWGTTSTRDTFEVMASYFSALRSIIPEGGDTVDEERMRAIAREESARDRTEYAAALQRELEEKAYRPITELQRRILGAGAALSEGRVP